MFRPSALAVIAVAIAPQATAATLLANGSFPHAAVGTLEFEAFDPALGTLESVSIVLQLNTRLSFHIAPNSVPFSGQISASHTFSPQFSGFGFATGEPTLPQTALVFSTGGGESGKLVGYNTSYSALLTHTTDLTGFVPPTISAGGNFTPGAQNWLGARATFIADTAAKRAAGNVRVNVVTQFEDPRDLRFIPLTATSGGSIAVTYTYTPAPPPPPPLPQVSQPASAPLLLSALFLLGLRRRRW